LIAIKPFSRAIAGLVRSHLPFDTADAAGDANLAPPSLWQIFGDSVSITYLQHLAAQELPYRTGNHTELDHIADLRAAHLIIATVPSSDKTGYAGEGVVRLITTKGRDELQTFGSQGSRA
jgi:hypothetical protein